MTSTLRYGSLRSFSHDSTAVAPRIDLNLTSAPLGTLMGYLLNHEPSSTLSLTASSPPPPPPPMASPDLMMDDARSIISCSGLSFASLAHLPIDPQTNVSVSSPPHFCQDLPHEDRATKALRRQSEIFIDPPATVPRRKSSKAIKSATKTWSHNLFHWFATNKSKLNAAASAPTNASSTGGWFKSSSSSGGSKSAPVITRINSLLTSKPKAQPIDITNTSHAKQDERDDEEEEEEEIREFCMICSCQRPPKPLKGHEHLEGGGLGYVQMVDIESLFD